MYVFKHAGRLPMKALVLVNGIKTWCHAFFSNDMHLLKDAHDEFADNTYIGSNDMVQRRNGIEQYTWVISHKRRLRNHITMMHQRQALKNGPLLLCFTSLDHDDDDDDDDDFI